MKKQKGIAERLRKYISEYDNVYVLEGGIPISEIFFQSISRQTTKKFLLLVNGGEIGGIPECGADIQAISDEEYCDIEELYYMYEFSDRIHLLADTTQYGSLGNYISNGLLTVEETFMALLLE